MLTRSSPVPIKGWLLPGLGSGHAKGDFKFSQPSSLTLGRGELLFPWPDTKAGCSISSSFLDLPLICLRAEEVS